MNQKSAQYHDAILVINCGSSSVKFSLMEPSTGNTILSGLAECLLTDEARITIKEVGSKTCYLAYLAV